MERDTVQELEGAEARSSPGPAEEGTRATLRGAAGLFAVGLLGGVLTVTGLVLFLAPLTFSHSCCGASETRVTQQRRCLELGVTPDELAALDAAARTGAAFGAAALAPVAAPPREAHDAHAPDREPSDPEAPAREASDRGTNEESGIEVAR